MRIERSCFASSWRFARRPLRPGSCSPISAVDKRRGGRRVLVHVAGAALVILGAAGCTATVAASPTPCPELAGWPPVGLPAPPVAVVVLHPPGSDLRVINQTGSAITIRYRVWTPLDCGLSPPAVGLASSRLRPGRAVEWSATDLVPTRGPVLGGLEVWLRPCNEPCPDPPDAFTSFELRPPSR